MSSPEPFEPPVDDVTPETPARGESRWPVTIAVVFLIGLPLVVSEALTLGPSWLLPGTELIFLVAIVVSDPGRIDRHSNQLRVIGIGMLVLFVVGSVWMTVALVQALINGDQALNSPQTLLATGALVWVNNNVVFAILYWELDGGGSANRMFHPRAFPDMAFPQHMNPEIRPPWWRPVFVDYLYLGVTNALAFSPTDVMPTAHWAKLSMALQSLISVVILSLVIARAVNIFT